MKKLLLVVGVLLFTLAVGFFVVGRTNQPDQNGSVMALIRPPFVSSAQAADLATYLDQEAGISAWFQASTAINLTNAKNACRAGTEPEIDTTDYFICSVPISGYTDRYYPHVYVHRDGWIMAYYFRADPTSKMLDVISRSLNNTLLKTAVTNVASAAGVAFSDVNYYDFRSPYATNMLLVAEDEANLNYFTIELPYYTYYERSWAFYDWYYCNFKLDGVDICDNPDYGVRPTAYGTIPPELLAPGVTHTFIVEGSATYAYGYVIITYGVP
jgi:S-adenosylmethionine/arginine decarboxylase-like enzyme